MAINVLPSLSQTQFETLAFNLISKLENTFFDPLVHNDGKDIATMKNRVRSCNQAFKWFLGLGQIAIAGRAL